MNDEAAEGNVDPATLDCSFLSPFQGTGGDCRPKVAGVQVMETDTRKHMNIFESFFVPQEEYLGNNVMREGIQSLHADKCAMCKLNLC